MTPNDKTLVCLKNESGFTLVETLVASTVLVIAILGANLQYISQLQAEAGMRQQMQSRAVLNKISTQVANNRAMFPRIYENVGHEPIVYIGCFYPDGTPRATSIVGHTASTSFVGTFMGLNRDQMSLPIRPLSQAQVDAIVATDGLNTSQVRNSVCNNEEAAGFEVHVMWMDAAPHKDAAQITSITIAAKGQGFKAASRVIQSYVY